MVYTYKCAFCKKVFAQSMTMKEYKEEVPCPECKHIAKRDPNDFAGGYIAKCSGFYGKKS